MPLISVIIASYNRACYLPATIESVLAQTHGNLEVIVIDDGSTDNTRESIAQYGDRVRYVWQVNAERGAARNLGLKLASGDLVAFLDSDDIWLPHKLECELQCLAKLAEAGIVYSDSEVIDAAGSRIGKRIGRRPEGWVTTDLLRGNFITFSAHLARISAIRAIGGFAQSRAVAGSEDWELWMRLSLRCQFAHLRRVTTLHRSHPGGTMSNAAWMERSMSNALARIEFGGYLPHSERDALPYTRAVVSLVGAINWCTAGERDKAWKMLGTAARNHAAILLDSRFAYTCARNVLPSNWVQQAGRAARLLTRQKTEAIN